MLWCVVCICLELTPLYPVRVYDYMWPMILRVHFFCSWLYSIHSLIVWAPYKRENAPPYHCCSTDSSRRSFDIFSVNLLLDIFKWSERLFLILSVSPNYRPLCYLLLVVNTTFGLITHRELSVLTESWTVYLIVRLSAPSPPSKIKGDSVSVPSIQGVRVGLRVGEPSTLCARLRG